MPVQQQPHLLPLSKHFFVLTHSIIPILQLRQEVVIIPSPN